MKTRRDEIARKLADAGYIPDRDLASAVWLMETLSRPLLLEGEAGVGKTEVAKALALAHDTKLIRLQCYEGLDQSAALYEWNYQRQLLAIKAREGGDADTVEEHIFSEKYLLERPLLAAIRQPVSPVLLIDEVDRADEEFDAFLLELLSDFQVSIPELGTIEATSIPRVILTSNGTRKLSDALRRRCLYHYVDFPDVDREARIIVARLPGIDVALSLQIARMVAGAWRRGNAGLGGGSRWAGNPPSRRRARTRVRNHDVPDQDRGRQIAHDARGVGPPAWQGGVRCKCKAPRLCQSKPPAAARAKSLAASCACCATMRL
jgi:MoxR-like ATPase